MRNLSAVYHIARATLRRKWVSLLAFAGGLAAFQALVVVSFPAIGGMAAVSSVVETFPGGLRQLLKLAPNLQAGFGLQDYLAFTWIHPLFLGLVAAFVVSRAADALAGDVERGAIYLLLSRPVPRWALVLGRALEMFVGVGILMAASWLGLALAVWLTGLEGVALGRFALVALVAWPLFAALGSVALAISSAGSRAAVAAGVGTAVTLIAFVLDVIPPLAASPLGPLNPWHHYFPQEIVARGALDAAALLILLLWLIVGLSVAIVVFGRRDLA